MQAPQYLLNVMLRFQGDADTVREQLQAVAGVAQVLVVPEENMAYLKVDNAVLDHAALERLRAPE